MKVTVHTVVDHFNSCEYMFGFDDFAYGLAMDFLKGKDTRQYEYFGVDDEIDFQWDVTPEQFEKIKHPPMKWDPEDYLGSLYFGNCKLEFILMQDGWQPSEFAKNVYIYCNLFVRNHEGYGILPSGDPYNNYEGFAAQIDSDIPKRRTFDAFAKIIERSVVESLNEYHQLVDDALTPTDPDGWYSLDHKPVKITRRA